MVNNLQKLFASLQSAIRIAGMSMLIGETMKLKFFNAGLLATAVFAGQAMNPVIAQTRDLAPAQRIEQGIASGQITPDEAQILTRREREIQRREAHYKSNGNATPQEGQKLRNELNALNAEVERMMANDEVVRPPVNAANNLEIDSPDYQVSERIDEGICSGRITQRQARRLQRREREIARHEVFFKSDGVVTPYEHRQLRDELDTLRNDVERMINTERQGRG